jgi:hypothetical protein
MLALAEWAVLAARILREENGIRLPQAGMPNCSIASLCHAVNEGFIAE